MENIYIYKSLEKSWIKLENVNNTKRVAGPLVWKEV